jgi:hypothetical protein
MFLGNSDRTAVLCSGAHKSQVKTFYKKNLSAYRSERELIYPPTSFDSLQRYTD